MANAKTKSHKKSETPAAPDDVRQLLELIIGEIEAPVDMQKLIVKVPPTTNCIAELRDFLKAKDRAHRREAFIKTEPMWFRKYGWFMARIVMVFGILVIVYSIITRNTSANFISALVLGAAFYYGLLVTLSNWRYRDKNKRRQRLLDEEGKNYQREIIVIAASLLTQFKIDARNYPIAKPKSSAGLENLEGKYFIPLPSE
ncbi:MAG: hypothetical protein AB1757_10300 [Acidobacteriota bacterium]